MEEVKLDPRIPAQDRGPCLEELGVNVCGSICGFLQPVEEPIYWLTRTHREIALVVFVVSAFFSLSFLLPPFISGALFFIGTTFLAISLGIALFSPINFVNNVVTNVRGHLDQDHSDLQPAMDDEVAFQTALKLSETDQADDERMSPTTKGMGLGDLNSSSGLMASFRCDDERSVWQ
jgi:hypothetical protein